MSSALAIRSVQRVPVDNPTVGRATASERQQQKRRAKEAVMTPRYKQERYDEISSRVAESNRNAGLIHETCVKVDAGLEAGESTDAAHSLRLKLMCFQVVLM